MSRTERVTLSELDSAEFTQCKTRRRLTALGVLAYTGIPHTRTTMISRLRNLLLFAITVYFCILLMILSRQFMNTDSFVNIVLPVNMKSRVLDCVEISDQRQPSRLQWRNLSWDPNRLKLNLSRNVYKIKYKKVSKNRFGINETYFEKGNIVKSSHPFQLMIEPRTTCVPKCPFLVVLVPSLAEHISVREVIRTSWGSVSFGKTWPNAAMNADVRFVFMFGKSKDTRLDSQIKSESLKYGDMIQEDFLDSYQNLTHKMLMGLKWVTSQCPGVKFILKADDDVFVNIPLLLDFLILRQKHLTNSVIGFIYQKSTVIRVGKWSVAKDAYPLKYYPRYAAGNTYVISSDLAAKIVSVSQYMTYVPIEDAYITGILTKTVHGNLVHSECFTFYLDQKPSSCSLFKHVRFSITKVNKRMMKTIWKSFKNNSCNDNNTKPLTKIRIRPFS